MTGRVVALAMALVVAVGLVVSCAALTGGEPARQTASGSPSPSGTATHSPKPSAKQSLKPGAKPTAKPGAQVLANVRWSGSGSRTSKPLLLAGDYVLRDSIATRPGCSWRVFIGGYDTAPMDEVMSNKAGSTSSEVPLVGLPSRRYTIRVIASKCGTWSLTLIRV
jgi:hypothetical protein